MFKGKIKMRLKNKWSSRSRQRPSPSSGRHSSAEEQGMYPNVMDELIFFDIIMLNIVLHSKYYNYND